MIAEDNSARQEILSSIRRNLSASAPFDAIHRDHRHDAQFERCFRTPPEESDLSTASLAKEFQSNLEAVGGKSTLVRDTESASAALRAIIGDLAPRRIAVSDSQIVRRLVRDVGSVAEILENAAASELFDCDVGITSAQWAIAETGTLVLQSEREFSRLTSLVPDIHICLMDAAKIRRTMAEILEIQSRDLDPTVTFITGPSRTSDIELTLAIGVHGPRELHVVVVG